MRIFVTGGAGFIGSNFIRLILTSTEHKVICFDKLTYAANLENLSDLVESPEYRARYEFIRGDICEPEDVKRAVKGADAVINFAAESHVDRSIQSAAPFITTNVLGTQVLIDCARAEGVARFIQISTDEVGGSLVEGSYLREDSPLAPSSPYAASKAAAEHIVQAAHHTHNFDTIITRTSNNYGPYQFPEKLLPLIISNAIESRPLPIYGDGLNIRDWIYVEDNCRAILEVLVRGRSGEIYNIGARAERTNLDIVRQVLKLLDRPASLITFVADRPGHDRRYGIDPSRIERELGWKPEVDLDEGLRRTIDWYLKNDRWLERTRSKQYLEYYEMNYSNRSEKVEK
jgi:dTDP-glucose 4,6-dehydratase